MDKKIHIFGAFDRFNYGDLLFPVILEKVILSSGIKCSIDYYGLIASDLRCHGGVATKPISKLRVCTPDKHIIIVAGGEVLGTPVWFLYNCYGKGLLRTKICTKLGWMRLNNKISRIRLGVKSSTPFVVTKKEYPNACILYNAVSGRLRKKKIEEFLSYVDYVSLRDRLSYEHVNVCGDTKNVFLSPDSAALVSEYFPKYNLENLVNKEIYRLVESLQSGYICFQAAYDYVLPNIQIIIKELRSIHIKCRLPIVLLPIGKAHMHCDEEGLELIRKEADIPCFLAKVNSIYDIMYLIAGANLFIGTSLHGSITAMSYAVPYIGVHKPITKLDSYLQTWGKNGFNSAVNFCDLGKKTVDVLKTDCSGLLTESKVLIKKTKQNFVRMMELISSY